MRVKMAGMDVGMLETLSRNSVAHLANVGDDANNLKASDELDTVTPSHVHLEPLDHPEETRCSAEVLSDECKLR
jgi:hypothetical protein